MACEISAFFLRDVYCKTCVRLSESPEQETVVWFNGLAKAFDAGIKRNNVVDPTQLCKKTIAIFHVIKKSKYYVIIVE